MADEKPESQSAKPPTYIDPTSYASARRSYAQQVTTSRTPEEVILAFGSFAPFETQDDDGDPLLTLFIDNVIFMSPTHFLRFAKIVENQAKAILKEYQQIAENIEATQKKP